MISHREAEALISARLDQQLDPLTERELSAHLATCPQCRVFARSTSVLASGLHDLPYLPASPAVSRGVMARVDQGRSPWANVGGLLTNPGPAFSTLAIIAVVLLLGFFVLNRFVLDGGTSPEQNNQQLASQPTVPPETPRNFALTGTPEPTATSEPTATDAPTATSEPTATDAPTATQTPEPTATTPPEPTATDEPMVAKMEETTAPIDLTGTAEEGTAMATSTPEPSPTETPEETSTPEPTATQTPPTPTVPSTPEGTEEAPPILPVEGGEVVPAPEDAEATSAATSEPTPDETPAIEDVQIQPIVTGDGTGNQQIEPIDDAEIEGTPVPGTETPEPTTVDVDDNAIDLAANSEAYGGIAGDPSGRLVLDDGRMEYQPQAHPAVLTSPVGITAGTTATDGGQAVTLCIDDDCSDVSSESANGPATDTPLSWINGVLLYARNADGKITYHALVPDESGTAAASDTLLYDGGSALEPTFPIYRTEGRVWVITQGAGWLALTDSTAHLYDSADSSARLLRFAESGDGAIVAYVAEGKVIVAPANAPGSPIGSAPFSGADFDVSPGSSQIVVSTGSAIEIYDLDGNLLTTYASPDMQPGTVLWLNSGIVFQDDASGVLMQIPNPQS